MRTDLDAEAARPLAGVISPTAPVDGEILARWAGSFAIGAVLVVTGWYLASGEPSVNDQIGPINIAVGGLLVAAIGHANVVRQMRNRLGDRRATVVSQLAAINDVAGVAEPEVVDAPADDRFVALADGRYFHCATCALVAGRAVIAVSRAEHARSRREPCGVCRP